MKQLRPTKKHHYFLLFLILILPFLGGIAYLNGFSNDAYAAIGIANQSHSNGASSWPHTVGNDANKVLVVGTNGGASAVTYGGKALTRAANSNNVVSLWYLVNPTIGTATVTVNGSGAIYGGAATFYNVDQSNPLGTTGTGSGGLSGQNFCNNNSLYMLRAYTTGSSSLFGAAAPLSPTNLNQIAVDYIIDTVNGGTMRLVPDSQQTSIFTQSVGGGTAGMSMKPASAVSTAMSWRTCGPGDGISSGSYNYYGISMTLNGSTTPPIPIPTVTPTPTPPPSGAGSGNIINLNFGINNSQPWIQTVCGDIRIDDGITNPVPAGQSTIATNASCTSPGIAFTGDTTPDFGDGQASSTNHVVGGATYPEVYSPSSSGGIFSSYTYLSQKAQSAQVPQTNLTGICTLSNCTLPPSLPNGIYYSPTNLVLNGYTFPANSDYVFLVNGTLTIGGDIIVPPSANSSVVFSVANNIIVRNTVGSAPASNAPNLSGIFSTDRSLILESTNNCSDLRLNIEGTIIVNAGLSGGFLQNNRDLCGNNATAPTMQITQRLDFILNLPEFVRIQEITSQEAAP